jgi:hypothetical protein
LIERLRLEPRAHDPPSGVALLASACKAVRVGQARAGEDLVDLLVDPSALAQQTPAFRFQIGQVGRKPLPSCLLVRDDLGSWYLERLDLREGSFGEVEAPGQGCCLLPLRGKRRSG